MSLHFTRSKRFTMGTELELQLTDKKSAHLVDKADIILSDTGHSQQIKHELTKSMIEINSAVHLSIGGLYQELAGLILQLRDAAGRHGCDITGGGRHLDADWREQVISDLQRHQDLAHRYGYITKMACVFGQHIHIGVNDGDEAMYLCHALIPYLPHLVALSASSPWLAGEDTRFSSSRFTGLNAFLNSELPENIYNWDEFNAFYSEMSGAGIIRSVKDIYWYVRPQPALGTVEIRICDMPLTLFHASVLTGYSKMLVRFLLKNQQDIIKKHRAIDKCNIFNARRDGLQARYICVPEGLRLPLDRHILQTVEKLTKFAGQAEDAFVLRYIKRYVERGITDADRIRHMIQHAIDLNTASVKMRRMLLSVPSDYRSL